MNRIERRKSRSRKRRRKARRQATRRREAVAFRVACEEIARLRALLRQDAVDLAYAYAAVELAEHRAACAERETQELATIVAAMRRHSAERNEA
jgi:hypothetical protein